MRNKVKFIIALTALTLVVAGVVSFVVKSRENSRSVEAAELTIDIGASRLYTQEELMEAADVIKNNFEKIDGGTIVSIVYAGDESVKNGEALFLVDFLENEGGNPSLEAGKDYRNFEWRLSHEDDGWTVKDYHLEVMDGTDLI
ncbi:MAG: hypothetical protein J5929_07555 [Eubacterium sp.]|nr:hypothetical protein [Eubacterium sp.]